MMSLPEGEAPLGGIASGAYFHPIYAINDNWFHYDETLMTAYSSAAGEAERHEAWMAIPRLVPRPVVECQVVWSSKLDLAEGGTGRVGGSCGNNEVCSLSYFKPSLFSLATIMKGPPCKRVFCLRGVSARFT